MLLLNAIFILRLSFLYVDDELYFMFLVHQLSTVHLKCPCISPLYSGVLLPIFIFQFLRLEYFFPILSNVHLFLFNHFFEGLWCFLPIICSALFLRVFLWDFRSLVIGSLSHTASSSFLSLSLVSILLHISCFSVWPTQALSQFFISFPSLLSAGDFLTDRVGSFAQSSCYSDLSTHYSQIRAQQSFPSATHFRHAGSCFYSPRA